MSAPVPTPTPVVKPNWQVVGGVIAIVCVAILIVQAVIGSVFGTPFKFGGASSSDGKKYDVTMTRCDITDSNYMSSAEVTVSVTNSSDSTRTYLIAFEIVDSTGTRVGNSVILVTDLAPGAHAVQKGVAVDSAPTHGSGRCQITDVS